MPEQLKTYRRHLRAYFFFRNLIRPFFKWWFNFKPELAPEIDGPFLLVANHNLDLDPVIISFSFKQMLYYVASEHIFRVGFASWFLMRYLSPISRLKGTADISTVKEVLKRLRAGMRVCIFAEGNRSFNGLTGEIPSSTGRLAQKSGVPLVTYRFEGGYLTAPRWALTKRKGVMRGYVVNVYTSEQLAEMSGEEINAAIAADLHEDAYARQAVNPIPFKGKRLAEGLEHSIFTCPSCNSIGTLRGQGNAFSCTCGLSVNYDVYGYLHGGPFRSVTEWDEWQHGQLEELAASLADELAFSDGYIRLNQVNNNHTSEELYQGTIEMYRDRIICGNLTFEIKNIASMQIYGRGNLTFNYGGTHFEVVSPELFCGRKYLELYKALRKEVRYGKSD